MSAQKSNAEKTLLSANSRICFIDNIELIFKIIIYLSQVYKPPEKEGYMSLVLKATTAIYGNAFLDKY